jgi:hypothetical protein
MGTARELVAVLLRKMLKSNKGWLRLHPNRRHSLGPLKLHRRATERRPPHTCNGASSRVRSSECEALHASLKTARTCAAYLAGFPQHLALPLSEVPEG